ncbi:hypothetical protein [Xenorhabdus cabanillasii]|uniref:hypothetical protein n=1 Tax=Xenorhabdus cabanillasii TaxID=351673 RepID=UPI0004AD86AB|nr:hypothetical protein [Xenorhabdus cabanillasii]
MIISDLIACKDHPFDGENKTPVACEGEHLNAVHLRTFGSRYRQTTTLRPAMKVIRCDPQPAYHATRATHLPRYEKHSPAFQMLTINVLISVQRLREKIRGRQ